VTHRLAGDTLRMKPDAVTTLRVLSLGWGVQSWTLAAMVALGELEPVDFIVHADTGYEHSKTYEHAQKWTPWLQERGCKVVTVKAKDNGVVVKWANSESVMIPALTVDRETGSHGQIKRQCTHDWKIAPIRHFITSLGITKSAGAVESWQGISWDEVRRIRDSDVAYITNRYPLVDLKMTRGDCIQWLQKNSLDVPVKSGCVFCPYNSMGRWKALKRDGGLDWDTAVKVDLLIRDKRPKWAVYVHPGRKPLEEAVSIPEDIGASQIAMTLDAEAQCDSGVCMT